MRTATINGKPSLYLTPETTLETPDFFARCPLPTLQEQWIETSRKMAEEHRQAEQEWLNDPEAQREYQEWSESLYNTPEAEAEHDAWCDAQEAEMDALCDAYDAEVSELAGLGDAGLHAIAGHDAVWQAGGEI